MFFGPEYKVLRGGSFAVDAVACRGTFRNWDYPIRRQIFSGFRTARTPGDGLMCRHLAYPGAAGGDSASAADGAAARAGPAVVGAPAPAARDRQRRRFRRRLVRGGRPGAGPLPAGRARLGGSVLRRPRPGGTHRRAARRRTGRAPMAGADGEAAAAPFAAGAWLFSHNGAVTGWPGSLAPRWPAPCPPRTCCPWRRATDSALLWALVLHRLRAGDDVGRRWPAPSWRSPRRPPAPGSTCCSPTARRSPRPPGATRSGTSTGPGRRTVVASEPLRRRPAAGRRCPTAPCVIASRTEVRLTPLQDVSGDLASVPPEELRT